MNLPSNQRQGFLGDLTSKSLPELKELLERQEKILFRRKFVNSLPDKGEKTRKFAEKLKEMIEERKAFVLSEKTSLDLVVEHQNHSEFPSPLSVDGEDLVSKFQGVSIDEPHSILQEDKFHGNSYERVIKKVELMPKTGKEKFMPNRTLKSGSTSLKASRNQLPKRDQGSSKVSHHVIEESAAQPPLYTFQESKLISIEESVQLIENQRNRSEELMAEQAAKRLAAQLAPKMVTYEQGALDLRYRETEEKDSDQEAIDSDDFEDEDDDND